MSEFYAEKNSESSLELFNKRTIYRTEMMLKGENNIVDFYAGEKIFYGRMSRRFAPIAMPAANTKRLRTSINPLSPLSAVNFVADIFNEMVTQFEKCVANNQIRAGDPHLSKLVAHRAYEDPKTLYFTYKNLYFSSILEKFRQNSIEVENFDEFIRPET